MVDEKDLEEQHRTFSKRLEGLMPEVLKRTISSSVGGLLMTEETVRELIKEFKLPKDALTYLISQSEKTREEIVRIISQEVRYYLENANMSEVIGEFLHNSTIEISTKIKFSPNEEEGGREVDSQVEVKKKKAAKGKKRTAKK